MTNIRKVGRNVHLFLCANLPATVRWTSHDIVWQKIFKKKFGYM